MRERILRRMRELAEQRALARSTVTGITDTALTENRNLTETEGTQVLEARQSIDAIDAETERLTRDLAELDAEVEAAGTGAAADATAAAEEAERSAAAAGAAGGTTVQVRREPLTYEREDIQRSYFMDLARTNPAFGIMDGEAQARIDRHHAEARVELPRRERHLARSQAANYAEDADRDRERRTGRSQSIEYRDLDRDAGDGGEFVPPLWMVDEFIDLSRGGRVTANLCRSMTLPRGTDSINIPKVATGTTVAMQTADNAAVSETDATTDSVTAPVRTIAGQQDVSLQLLEQSPIAFDEVIFADLAGDHAEVMDGQVLNGSAASGQVRGILQIGSVDTTTYTDASPTVPELWPKLADSANEVATNRFRPAEAVIMHPRRWFWMLSQLDSNNRPFLALEELGPQNALFAAEQRLAEGRVGVSPFGPIHIDPNMPTNLGGGTEDRIIVNRPSEQYLFEGATRTRVLPEVLSGTLTVRFQLYNYVAFMPDRRPEGTSVIAGTGLAAPTF